MPAPYLNLNNAKIAPFKYSSAQPYGAFVNTTPVGKSKEYRIHQMANIDGRDTHFNWPSSEHAYHAQKIIHLKSKLHPQHPAQQSLTNMLNDIESINEEFSPRKHYDGLVNRYLPELNQRGLSCSNKHAFDAHCDADYHAVYNPNGSKKSIDFMREIIRLKLSQHSDIANTAIECAKDGVLPVEVSQYDSNWASGPDGRGENLLGILILEEGNKLLMQQGGTPAIPNPQQAYQSLKFSQNLRHDNLVKMIQPGPNWYMPQMAYQAPTAHSSAPNKKYSYQIEYFESRGGNQRLVIQNEKVVGFEFRKDKFHPWQKSSNLNRFNDLVQSYLKSKVPSKQNQHFDYVSNSPSTPGIGIAQQQPQRHIQPNIPGYFLSRGENQRLKIEQGKVTGYEYRIDRQDQWKASGDPSRFDSLVKAFQIEKNIKPHYEYATLDNGRKTHFWSEATSFKKEYQNLKGDVLKTRILIDFKSQLDNCANSYDLKEIVNKFKDTDDYKILAKSQGFISHLFSLKTSSVKALESMIEARNSELSGSSYRIK